MSLTVEFLALAVFFAMVLFVVMPGAVPVLVVVVALWSFGRRYSGRSGVRR